MYLGDIGAQKVDEGGYQELGLSRLNCARGLSFCRFTGDWSLLMASVAKHTCKLRPLQAG